MSSNADSRKSDRQDSQNDITDLGNKNVQTGMSNLRGLTRELRSLWQTRMLETVGKYYKAGGKPGKADHEK